MRSAFFPSSSDPNIEPLKRRAASLTLVVVVHLLLLLLLLRLAPPPSPPKPPPFKGVLLDLKPERKVTTDRSKSASKSKSESGRPAPKAKSFVAPKPVVKVPSMSNAQADAVWAKVTRLTREELADTDAAISKGKDARQSADRGDSGNAQMASSAAVGTAPNGETLYEAQWYKHPTNAELQTYLPPNAPRTGWGMIVCQTIEGYRVDNCSEIGQSPPGSGFARAVREAAWQFRVLPPRINGRPQIGSWVRIRIDYVEMRAKR